MLWGCSLYKHKHRCSRYLSVHCHSTQIDQRKMRVLIVLFFVQGFFVVLLERLVKFVLCSLPFTMPQFLTIICVLHNLRSGRMNWKYSSNVCHIFTQLSTCHTDWQNLWPVTGQPANWRMHHFIKRVTVTEGCQIELNSTVTVGFFLVVWGQYHQTFVHSVNQLFKLIAHRNMWKNNQNLKNNLVNMDSDAVSPYPFCIVDYHSHKCNNH